VPTYPAPGEPRQRHISQAPLRAHILLGKPWGGPGVGVFHPHYQPRRRARSALLPPAPNFARHCRSASPGGGAPGAGRSPTARPISIAQLRYPPRPKSENQRWRSTPPHRSAGRGPVGGAGAARGLGARALRRPVPDRAGRTQFQSRHGGRRGADPRDPRCARARRNRRCGRAQAGRDRPDPGPARRGFSSPAQKTTRPSLEAFRLGLPEASAVCVVLGANRILLQSSSSDCARRRCTTSLISVSTKTASAPRRCLCSGLSVL
jgi:hypothetical protein